MKLGLATVGLAFIALAAISNAPLTASTTPAGSVTVTPGHSGTNGNVTVVNSSSSHGTAHISPGTKPKNADGTGGGPPSGPNNVRTDAGVDSTTTGLKDGDSVDLGNANTGSVTGKGGTVNLGAANSVTVTNNGTGNGPSITVKYPNGGTATIPPGSTATFHS
jgi:hypothetical protein